MFTNNFFTVHIVIVHVTFQNAIYFKHLLYNIIKGINAGYSFVKVKIIAIREPYQLNT